MKEKIFSSDVAEIVNGTLTGNPRLEVSGIVTDSRHLNNTEGLLFIAIRGKNHDGHLFINNLYNAGIRIFLVEELPEDLSGYGGAAFIVARNSVSALQKLAACRRKSFHSLVIGVTGSAGKTIVKEWLADVLSLQMPVIRSPKSYNSQIGVPLSVWKLDDKYKLAIFEAGISHPGEMDNLRNVINPDIGIITNIGDAHNENFSGNREKAAEKLKLFSGASSIVFCLDHEIIRQEIFSHNVIRNKRLFGWSFLDPKAAVFVRTKITAGGKTELELAFKGKAYLFEISFTDRASIENAITVATVCLILEVPAPVIRKGLSGLVSVAMRMERKNGINDCLLIEDYYNSDPGSLGMAIDYLKLQAGRKATLILSDFVQSGREEHELYSEVAGLVEKAGIEKFIGIGDALVRNSSLFRHGSLFYNTTDDFLRNFYRSDFQNEVILLKGARIYEFEKIGALLEQQAHQTVLEVSLDAVAHNLNEFRRFLNPSTKIMAMVKAFAYGAGPAEIASLMEYQRANYLAVAYADEGVELRNSGVTLPVMVMNPDPGVSEIMIKYNLEPEIYSFSTLERFTAVASRHGLIDYPVHIKIDSGMHRLGFMPGEVGELASKLSTGGSIKVISVFSHLAASEDPSLDYFTHRQAKTFLEASDIIGNSTGYRFIRHLLNSSGIVRFPQYQFEMVRTGIGIYGAGHFEGLSLKTAGRFKTRISQVKNIEADEPVGYGCAGKSPYERTIAILPVGYADGLNRKLGNGTGNLFIRGKRVPLIGNICMDMCMADVTGIGAQAGDEAEIFGENIPIDELAIKCGTITYEILTSIPARVKRIFFSDLQ